MIWYGVLLFLRRPNLTPVTAAHTHRSSDTRYVDIDTYAHEQAALVLVCLAGAVAVVTSVVLGFSTPPGAVPVVVDLFVDLVRH